MFNEGDSTDLPKLVVIQCDLSNPQATCNLVACARHRIYDARAQKGTKSIVHILFVIHYPYSEESSLFVGFPWISAHIDDLRPSVELCPQVCMGSSLSDLFVGKSNAQRLKDKGNQFSFD